MKANVNRMVVLALVALLLAALVPATGLAAGNKTAFSGTQCLGERVDPGSMEVLGNGTVRMTGIVEWAREDMSDPRVTGDALIGLNMILDLDTGSGPLWGMIELMNDQGNWSGHWTGRLDNWSDSLQYVIHGAGTYEGLVSHWTVTRSDITACFDVTGYIVETGANK